jgi:hypothetical protein
MARILIILVFIIIIVIAFLSAVKGGENDENDTDPTSIDDYIDTKTNQRKPYKIDTRFIKTNQDMFNPDFTIVETIAREMKTNIIHFDNNQYFPVKLVETLTESYLDTIKNNVKDNIDTYDMGDFIMHCTPHKRDYYENFATYNKDRVFKNNSALFDKLYATLGKTEYLVADMDFINTWNAKNNEDLPVIKLRYIFTLFNKDKSLLFNSRADIKAVHIPFLKAISKFIDEKLLQLYYKNSKHTHRFHSYIKILDGEFPHIYAEYVPIIGQYETRPYELYNMMLLQEVIYGLGRDSNFQSKFNLKKVINYTYKPPRRFVDRVLYNLDLDIAEANRLLKLHKTILTCIISIGSIDLITTDGEEFYLFKFKFNRDFYLHTDYSLEIPRQYASKKINENYSYVTSNYLPYTLLEYRKIGEDKLLRMSLKPVFKITITDISKQYSNDLCSIIPNHVIDIKNSILENSILENPLYRYHLHTVGRDEHGDNAFDPSTIEQLSYGELDAFMVKSKAIFAKTDNNTVIGRPTLDFKAYEIEKYNMWVFPKKYKSMIFAADKEFKIEKPNAIYSYNKSEIKDLIKLIDIFIKKCESKSKIKTDSIVYFTLPNNIKNNSFHVKYDSNKVVNFDSITLANRRSSQKYKSIWWKKAKETLKIDSEYYNHYSTDIFEEVGDMLYLFEKSKPIST